MLSYIVKFCRILKFTTVISHFQEALSKELWFVCLLEELHKTTCEIWWNKNIIFLKYKFLRLPP